MGLGNILSKGLVGSCTQLNPDLNLCSFKLSLPQNKPRTSLHALSTLFAVVGVLLFLPSKWECNIYGSDEAVILLLPTWTLT